jgi:hypothetical protein
MVNVISLPLDTTWVPQGEMEQFGLALAVIVGENVALIV